MASDFSVTRESKPRADERLTGIAANFRGAVSRSLPRLIDCPEDLDYSLVVQMPGSHWPKLGRCIKSSIQGSGPERKIEILAKGLLRPPFPAQSRSSSPLPHPPHASTHVKMAAMMSSAAVSARVAPAASGKKIGARSSAFSAAMPVAAKRVNASVKSRGAMRVVAELEEPLVKIGTRGR